MSNSIRLYVNIDHVATLREARRTDEPDPRRAAEVALAHGAHGITFHLREDRRHIQDHDVHALADSLRCPLNFELAARTEVVDLACRIRPHQATLVPESREEVTTEGGLDLQRADPRLDEAIFRLQAAGIRVALFIDPEPEAVERAHALGVPAVELHTGRYANQRDNSGPSLAELARAATLAHTVGLAVHAGHGLTRHNVRAVAAIPEIEELNIGHSIIAQSITIGIGAATREMTDQIQAAGR